MNNLTKAAFVSVLLASASVASAQFGSGRGYHYNFPDYENPTNCTQFVRSQLRRPDWPAR